jgi:hypothetical protein
MPATAKGVGHLPAARVAAHIAAVDSAAPSSRDPSVQGSCVIVVYCIYPHLRINSVGDWEAAGDM